MNLKKLIPELVAGLKDVGFDESPTEIQTKSVSQIKSGTDLFIVAPLGAGKSTAIVIGVIQQLKEEVEEAPRAIIMVATREKAVELEEQFDILGKHTNLRTYVVSEKGKLLHQKDRIYEGLDVLIGTPKRLNELLKFQGIPLAAMNMLVVDDADKFTLDKYVQIYRIADNLAKAQFIMVANTWNKYFPVLSERMMKNPKVIKAK